MSHFIILTIPDFGETYCELAAIVKADSKKQALATIKPYVGGERMIAVPIYDWLYNPATNSVGE